MARFRVLALVALASSALFACAQILGFDKDHPDAPGATVMHGEAGASSASSTSSGGEPGPGLSSGDPGSSSSSSSSGSASSSGVAMATTFEGNLGRGTILIESGNLVWTDEDAGTISWRAVDGGGSSAVVDSGAGAITITSHQGDLFWAHIDAGAMLSRLSPATSSAFDGGFTNVASLRTITVGSTDTDRSRIFAMNTAGLITFSDIATNERGTIGDGGRALEVGTETGGKCACWASGNQVNCYSDKLGQASLLDAGGAPTALAWGQSSLFRARLFVLFGTELRMFEDTGSHLYCSQITWGAATNVASNVSALASDGRAAFYATGSIGYKVDSTMSTGVPVGAFNGTCTSIAADRVTNTAFCRNVNGIVRFP